MYVCMRVCMYLCMFIYINIYIYIPSDIKQFLSLKSTTIEAFANKSMQN